VFFSRGSIESDVNRRRESGFDALSHQPFELQQGGLEIRVHQHRVKFRRRLQLLAGPGEAALDRLLAVGAPAADAAL